MLECPDIPVAGGVVDAARSNAGIFGRERDAEDTARVAEFVTARIRELAKVNLGC